MVLAVDKADNLNCFLAGNSVEIVPGTKLRCGIVLFFGESLGYTPKATAGSGKDFYHCHTTE